jgi:hypothetical protein
VLPGKKSWLGFQNQLTDVTLGVAPVANDTRIMLVTELATPFPESISRPMVAFATAQTE